MVLKKYRRQQGGWANVQRRLASAAVRSGQRKREAAGGELEGASEQMDRREKPAGRSAGVTVR